MKFTPKILAFAGSTRTHSHNKKLVKIAASGARAAGAEVTLIDLRDYPLPLYDGDLEEKEGLPDNAVKLKELFKSHHGFLISCPEYNSSITGVLKNTIDWVSRPREGETSLAGFMGKGAALMSASPGVLGGLRGLVHVRSILGNLGVFLLPEQIAVTKAHEAFNEEGRIVPEKLHASVENLGASLARFLEKLKPEG
ncbi:MAG: NAD(P)H-dependent oxidoreductase [bacterium]